MSEKRRVQVEVIRGVVVLRVVVDGHVPREIEMPLDPKTLAPIATMLEATLEAMLGAGAITSDQIEETVRRLASRLGN